MEEAFRRFLDVTPTLQRDHTFGFFDRSTPTKQIFSPKLIANTGTDTMLAALKAELRRSTSFTFSVAFVTSQAIATLKQALLDFPGRGTIITSTYLGFNNPGVFKELLNLSGIKVFVHEHRSGFHPKGYVFEQEQTTTAIVGSSNLTEYALSKNTEWNLRFSALPDGDIVDQLHAAIQAQLDTAVPLTAEWITEYERTYVPPERRRLKDPLPEELQYLHDEEPAITPNEMQRAALAEIQKVRDLGEKRAIVVSATGTGKTILAALDVQAVAPQRMLFVVHREQILDRAIEEFKRVLRLPDDQFGKYVGSVKELDRRFVFATVQSLSKAHVLEEIPSDLFDYILIDEVHRAGADTYQRVIDHFDPAFLLGFTATPERTDGKNLFEIFDFNVPYEIRLQEALSRDMLAPFHYYGVTDYETASGEVITEISDLHTLVLPERIAHIITALETYGHVGIPVRGLMFCSRKDEARTLSESLNKVTVHGSTLRTVALTGDDSVEHREATVQRLERGELDYILTVDVFNEGVDIPSVNQIVMLRQTKSSIIFTQQLGRGLRKAEGKDHLRVIDFIGNYTNNFLIPIALFGDNSLNKDSVRKHLRDAEELGVISGISSVNFDEISKKRVFASLAAAKLDSMVNLKATYRALEFRLGRPPMLIDFARFDAADPVVMATKHHNYWNFLLKLKAAEDHPSPYEDAVLKFLDGELLNGKRPHELIILRELFKSGSLTQQEILRLLSDRGCATDEMTMQSLTRVLDLSFYTTPERSKYGNEPIVSIGKDLWRLNGQLHDRYQSNTVFTQHVDDAINTGLFLSRHRYQWAQQLTVGGKYSRKDVCRLLNWRANEQGSIFGYKVDVASNSCPIFITYHKDDDVSASTKYGDEFINESQVHWFTRSNRTLKSKEVRSIVDNALPLHLFAKKDDAEGLDFYYLGEATSANAVETTMPDDSGKQLPVVTMDLHLGAPIDHALYDYLTTPTLTP